MWKAITAIATAIAALVAVLAYVESRPAAPAPASVATQPIVTQPLAAAPQVMVSPPSAPSASPSGAEPWRISMENGRCRYSVRSDLAGDARESALAAAQQACAETQPAWTITRLPSGGCRIGTRNDLSELEQRRARAEAEAACDRGR